MVQFEALVKRVGGSLAILVPNEIAKKAHVTEKKRVHVELKPECKIGEFFGLATGIKTPTAKIMAEIKKGWE